MNFPVFESLSVNGYRLYPGLPDEPGLTLQLSPGPWIVLGVNGLGKSTLLLLLKHALVGPVRLRGVGFSGAGSEALPLDPRFFAVRVGDNAQSATVNLQARFGSSILQVTRRLSDLALVSATLAQNGENLETTDQTSYGVMLANAMGLARFEDALRALDRVTFFLESREPLIWDVSAQFELFRALLTPDISEDLKRLESAIVSADSSARNLNAIIYKLTKRRDANLAKLKGSEETRARLSKASAALAEAQTKETDLRVALEGWDERRSDARVEFKRAEISVDDATQKYEEAKFEVLRHAFASVAPNEQYVFLKLISEQQCIACGNEAKDAAAKLEDWRTQNRCLVCGTQRPRGSKVVATATAMQERADEAFLALQEARAKLESTSQKYKEAERSYRDTDVALEAVRQEVDVFQREARRLRQQLPQKDQDAVAADESSIAVQRREVQNFRRERDEAEEEIANLLSILKGATEAIRERLEANFYNRAKDFFAEQVRLVYAPRKDRIGQGGRVFEFPAFEVEMTSSATAGEFVRRRAEQVSLSQREYLDIIFRISLIETLGDGHGSLVVDGPEGSLDAVFARRAGRLYADVAGNPPSAVILLACNIVDGAFIPNVLRNFPAKADRVARVINLLHLGAPTAALIELRGAYDKAVNNILSIRAD